MLIDLLEWITCRLLWCAFQLFGLSFWRHPFTVEDPLVSEWCNATFFQIWWRNKLLYILDFNLQQMFTFGGTVPFPTQSKLLRFDQLLLVIDSIKIDNLVLSISSLGLFVHIGQHSNDLKRLCSYWLGFCRKDVPRWSCLNWASQ